MRVRHVALATLMAAVALTAPAVAQQAGTLRQPDVIFVPTPPEVVDAMLKLANVTAKDVVYDLGCGNGIIVATAASKFGARAVGIDIDPQRIKESNETVQKMNVTDKVKILNEDLFQTDISQATVVTLYLLPSLNQKLVPKLNKELKPGTGLHYNPYFANLNLAMAKPLSDGQVTYADGTKATVDQMAKDVSAFLVWTAEPKLVKRVQVGWAVMGFLLIFTVLTYLSYRNIWADKKH